MIDDVPDRPLLPPDPDAKPRRLSYDEQADYYDLYEDDFDELPQHDER